MIFQGAVTLAYHKYTRKLAFMLRERDQTLLRSIFGKRSIQIYGPARRLSRHDERLEAAAIASQEAIHE